MTPDPLNLIRAVISSSEDRTARAANLARVIRNSGGYRWVGIYNVGTTVVSIIAWDGPGAPAYPSFPITQGLTGSAIEQRATVVVGDVRNDPRYLTAFGSTLSEIIIPVLHPENGNVVGTIDVESEHADAFSDQDRAMLEQCAREALPLWISPTR
jgi:putative methionine-R-sulfoxide reductase with GAF domain